MKPRSVADHWLASRRRAQAAREAARRDADSKKPRPIVLASNYPGPEEGGVTGLYRCPAFDGIEETQSESIHNLYAAPASEYHWTREGLEAEAERRGAELMITVFSDMTWKEDHV